MSAIIQHDGYSSAIRRHCHAVFGVVLANHLVAPSAPARAPDTVERLAFQQQRGRLLPGRFLRSIG